MLAASSGEPDQPAEPPPSAELLLYLGEFEDAQGVFLDPMALEALPEQPEVGEGAEPGVLDEREKRDETASRPE